MAEDPKTITTKEELKELLADRLEDPALFDDEGRLAEWMQEPTHPDRVHARAREQEITRVEARLEEVSDKLELDWDTSS